MEVLSTLDYINLEEVGGFLGTALSINCIVLVVRRFTDGESIVTIICPARRENISFEIQVSVVDMLGSCC